MITFEGYTLDGFKLTFSLPCDTVEQALSHVRAAKQAGVTPEPQDPDAQQTETIVTVVRREHEDKNGRITPVVDFYPAWQGDYGQFRFCGVYLNTPEDIAQFESQSGLKLMNMPLYEAQGPLQRKPGSAKRMEIACKPFTANKVAGEEKEVDGKLQKTWKFAGYGAALATSQPNTSAPLQTPVSASPDVNPGTPLDIDWLTHGLFIKWAWDTFSIPKEGLPQAIAKTKKPAIGLKKDEAKGAVLASYCNYDSEKVATVAAEKELSADVVLFANTLSL